MTGAVLRDRAADPARREAWVRDQYQHPEEHVHTLAEVQGSQLGWIRTLGREGRLFFTIGRRR